MTAEGHSVASLTGGIEGQRRDEIIDKFRDGNAKVLITTNVLARGIDVQTVSMVINYVSLYQPYNYLFSSDIISNTYRNYRTSPNYIFPANSKELPTPQLTYTASDVPVVLAAPVSPSPSSPTRSNGLFCKISSSISTATSCDWILMTGTKLKKW